MLNKILKSRFTRRSADNYVPEIFKKNRFNPAQKNLKSYKRQDKILDKKRKEVN